MYAPPPLPGAAIESRGTPGTPSSPPPLRPPTSPPHLPPLPSPPTSLPYLLHPYPPPLLPAVPSAPRRAGGGAHANTLNGASVLQRMTCPVPGLPACDTCHSPCHRGTSTGRSKRPAEAGGVRVEGSGRGRGPGVVPERHGQQPGRRGGVPLAPDPPPPPRDAPPLDIGGRAAGPARHRPSPGLGGRPPERDVRARRDLNCGPGHACTVPRPPPPPVGTGTPSRSARRVQLSTMTRHHVAYPPDRPPPRRCPRTGWAFAGRSRFPAAACTPGSSGRAAGWRRATRRRPSSSGSPM